jgi:hypothetical protein
MVIQMGCVLQTFTRCWKQRGLMTKITLALRSGKRDSSWRMRLKRSSYFLYLYLDMETWVRDAVERLRDQTVTMSERKAGLSHAKNMMARTIKQLDQAQHFKDCYKAL